MIILASQSPRRKQLMSLICRDFTVAPADIDETVTENINAEKIPELLALKKAEHIFKSAHSDDTVIGCDTGVFSDGVMLGKPKNEADAEKMLRLLSGREHKVITGCAVLKGDEKITFSKETSVKFYPLTGEEIKRYIATGEPMDKAGAYGIQGRGALFVKSIKGDYFSVVGLPVAELARTLRGLR